MSKDVKFNIKLQIDGKEHVVTATSTIRDLQKAIKGAKESAEDLKDGLVNFNQTTILLQNSVSALKDLSQVFNDITSESRSFSAAMAEANTMAGKTGADFDALKGSVAELAKEVPMARDALAKGLYQVISNGVPEDNWIEYLRASSRAAVGGIADVGKVVEVTSTVIKNYGLEWSAAQDIQDKIQLTAKNGVTSFEQLASALPAVTGQAAQLGVSFTEMLAVMSTLTDVTGNTSEVATQLSSVLTALTKESSKSQKMAAAMGIEFNAASIKAAGGLKNYLQELDKTVTAYAQKTGMLKESIYSKLFGRAEALRLVNGLTGDMAKKFEENIGALTDSMGTIDKAFDTMANTGSSKLQMLQNQFASIADTITKVVGPALPVLNFTSQVGLSVVALTNLIRLLKLSSVKAVAASAKTNLVATAYRLMGIEAKGSAFYIKGTTVALNSMQVALRGVMLAMGVGIAVSALSTIMSALSSKTAEAAGKTEELQSAESAFTTASAQTKVALDKETTKLKELIDRKQDTTEAIKHLNKEYGSIFGQHKTAAEWYDTLIAKSKAYAMQLGYEAKAREIASKIAENETSMQMNLDQQNQLWKEGKGKVKSATVVGTGTAGNTQTVYSYTYSKEMVELRKARGAVKKETDALYKQLEMAQQGMADYAKQVGATNPTPETSGGPSSSDGSESSGKSTTKSLKPLEGSLQALKNEVAELQKKLEYGLIPESAIAKTKQRIDDLQKGIKAKEIEISFRPPKDLSLDNIFKDNTVTILPKIDLDWQKNGLEKLPVPTDEMRGFSEETIKAFNAVGSLGSSFAALGSELKAPELAIAGTIAQAIANVALSFSAALAQSTSLGPWGWIGFAATGIAQMVSVISSIKGATAFADGGVVSGPTYALVGEYAGASNNPEVIAPLDKLRSMIEPAGAVGGNFSFRIQGRDLVAALANETRTSGKRSNIKL